MINTEQLREYSQKAILTIWDGDVFVSAAAVKSTREIFRDFINSLLALGADAPIQSVESAFVTCVRRLNDLDFQDQFICKSERIDLLEELWTLGDICGVADSVDDWCDGERRW